MDYQILNEISIEEYSEVLKSSGWEIIKSYENMLYLRGTKESEEIYTDKETMNIRQDKFSNQLGKGMISLGVIFIVLILWRIFMGKVIDIDLINLLIDTVIGAFIGFTVMFLVGYFKVKLKR